jgi:hypothetical protein
MPCTLKVVDKVLQVMVVGLRCHSVRIPPIRPVLDAPRGLSLLEDPQYAPWRRTTLAGVCHRIFRSHPSDHDAT